MKEKIIYFFTCFLTYLVVFIVEFMTLSFIFTIFQVKGFFLPFVYVALLIIVNPLITWVLANTFYTKIQKGNSSEK
ncbi:MAG: hypothetical protein ACK5L6_07875 [Anaerorhabdus sp.]